jgi:hypothetical protein
MKTEKLLIMFDAYATRKDFRISDALKDLLGLDEPQSYALAFTICKANKLTCDGDVRAAIVDALMLGGFAGREKVKQ